MPASLRVLLVLVLAVLLGSCGNPGRSSPPEIPPGRSSPAETTALAVLHDWDRHRAAAWVAGDVRALAGLYVPGSRAGARDVAALRAYRDRGLRITRMREQVLAARTLRRTPTEIRLEVVDRVADVAVDDGRSVRRLPVGHPVRRRLDLRRVDGTWRVVAVRPLPSAARR